ncbi:MAG: hypothetical protein QOG05_4733 [Streptosporangiaceae bacterium]|jgi:hypothetical protein|nr:hypothetical protein [Streptosporangiaceae bacterium]
MAGERLVLIDAGLGFHLQRTLGAVAHFPELQFGRILTGTARRWAVA